jgi:ABC-type multidrug transport system ATPase subunit
MSVRLEHVGKRYGRGPWILEDVELELSAGSLDAVVGGNGCGKSTLLRIVAGVGRPSRGTVRNRPARVAYVPDRFAPPRLTARAYLDHVGRLRRLPVAARRRRLDELADLLALVPGPDQPLATLSRGNAKKVALAQAFMAPVDLIVLDEPRAALDDDARDALDALVAAARREGAAVVVAEHGEPPAGAALHTLVGGRLEAGAGR